MTWPIITVTDTATGQVVRTIALAGKLIAHVRERKRQLEQEYGEGYTVSLKEG